MSDPVSNSEVEDVLSSIRRLVSEDRHPINRNRLDVPKDDKLVLTPSFRVASDTPAADSFRSQRKPMQPSGAMGGGTSRDTADFAFPAEAQNDNDHLDPSADPSDVFHSGEIENSFDPASRLSVAEEFEDVDLIADELDQSPQNIAADTKRTNIEEEKTQHLQSNLSAFRFSARPPGILDLGASELVEDVPPTPDRLSAKIAALETAISRIPETYEPDEPGDNEYSGSDAPAMAWEDDVELDATGARLSAVADEGALDATLTFSPGAKHSASDDIAADPLSEMEFASEDLIGDIEDEMAQKIDPVASREPEQDAGLGLGGEEYIDEEMLRDLVSEIVRTELQGALGERITRNVRKLVRREIHRALTSQDLE
tara:strand:- start:574 stop:1686 length:1113 start_codon:yes stop_codon:yes gene_type:complete